MTRQQKKELVKKYRSILSLATLRIIANMVNTGINETLALTEVWEQKEKIITATIDKYPKHEQYIETAMDQLENEFIKRGIKNGN